MIKSQELLMPSELDHRLLVPLELLQEWFAAREAYWASRDAPGLSDTAPETPETRALSNYYRNIEELLENKAADAVVALGIEHEFPFPCGAYMLIRNYVSGDDVKHGRSPEEAFNTVQQALISLGQRRYRFQQWELHQSERSQEVSVTPRSR